MDCLPFADVLWLKRSTGIKIATALSLDSEFLELIQMLFFLIYFCQLY
jgi:hypothetical protein